MNVVIYTKFGVYTGELVESGLEYDQAMKLRVEAGFLAATVLKNAHAVHTDGKGGWHTLLVLRAEDIYSIGLPDTEKEAAVKAEQAAARVQQMNNRARSTVG